MGRGPDRPGRSASAHAARRTQRGIRRWLTGPALLTGTAARAQSSPPVPEAALGLGLPLGPGVGSAVNAGTVAVRGEPVTVRALHRSGAGLGIGQDYFLAGPGFVGGLWDANLRYGWDVGGRWGAGHVDLNSAFVKALYRRHYDVFGQPFVGLNATLDIPMGGYPCLFG